MKNILKTIGLVFGLGLFMQACDDWTMPEANIIQNLDGTPKSEEYYRKLRAYKKTDHQIAFGWFGFGTEAHQLLQEVHCAVHPTVWISCLYGETNIT